MNHYLYEQMHHDQGPDAPSGLISPPPGGEPVVKEEPEDEDAPEPPEIVVGDKDDEDSEDEEDIGDIHDDDDAMEDLIANPTEVWTLSSIADVRRW